MAAPQVSDLCYRAPNVGLIGELSVWQNRFYPLQCPVWMFGPRRNLPEMRAFCMTESFLSATVSGMDVQPEAESLGKSSLAFGLAGYRFDRNPSDLELS
jgi:hypothetical protein